MRTGRTVFWAKYIEIYEQEMGKPPHERDAVVLQNYTHMFFDDIATRPRFLRSFGHFHKWQYDEIQLTSMMKKAGFCQSERKLFHDSLIPDIVDVEVSDFLIVESIK